MSRDPLVLEVIEHARGVTIILRNTHGREIARTRVIHDGYQLNVSIERADVATSGAAVVTVH